LSGDRLRGDQGVRADDPTYLAEPARTVTLLAEVLGTLHQLPPDASRSTIDRLIVARILEDRLAGAGSLDRIDAAAYRHLTVPELLTALHAGADPDRDAAPVPTHGQPTLARLHVRDGAAVGLVDWSCSANAPAARDVAVALLSLVATLGPGVAPAFAAAYPAPMPTVEQVDWWVLAAVLSTHADSIADDAKPLADER